MAITTTHRDLPSISTLLGNTTFDYSPIPSRQLYGSIPTSREAHITYINILHRTQRSRHVPSPHDRRPPLYAPMPFSSSNSTHRAATPCTQCCTHCPYLRWLPNLLGCTFTCSSRL